MNNWTCPHCKGKMYSSWDRRDEKKATCIYCGFIFANPYYQGKGGRGWILSREAIEEVERR